MMGDFNIAPTDIDVFDPDLWREKILCSSVERKHFSEFEDLLLADSFRLKNKKPNQYSWWSYRANSRANNKGWRIDYNMVSKSIEERIVNASILSDIHHSDHCPIKLELSI